MPSWCYNCLIIEGADASRYISSLYDFQTRTLNLSSLGGSVNAGKDAKLKNNKIYYTSAWNSPKDFFKKLSIDNPQLTIINLSCHEALEFIEKTEWIGKKITSISWDNINHYEHEPTEEVVSILTQIGMVRVVEPCDCEGSCDYSSNGSGHIEWKYSGIPDLKNVETDLHIAYSVSDDQLKKFKEISETKSVSDLQKFREDLLLSSYEVRMFQTIKIIFKNSNGLKAKNITYDVILDVKNVLSD